MNGKLQLFAFVSLAFCACSSSGNTSGNDLSTGVGGGGGGGGGGGSADLGGVATPPDLSPTGPVDMLADNRGVIVSDALAMMVTGHYAMQSKSSSIQDLPFVGKTPSTSVSLGLADVQRDGMGLKLVEQGCHVSVKGGMLAMTTIPDAVPRSVPPTSAPFHVWDENGTIKWQRPESVVTIGVMLANPLTDVLPTMASDPRIWDQDKDGQPGVTVKVSGFASGDIYVVQKVRGSYAGTIPAAHKVSGLVSDASEQAVIGASNPTLNQNIKSMPDPDPTKNTIVLVPVDATYDCAKVIANETTLFP